MNSGKKSGSETEIFLAAMSDVKPLKPDNRQEKFKSKPPPLPRQSLLDEEMVKHELLENVADPADFETGEELFYLRPDYNPRLLRRLRRGHFSVADTIDLHHMSESTSRDVLIQFLLHAIRSGYGSVRVIHGKGLRSNGPPKLKIMTRSVLRKTPQVIAFASCRPVDGGTGAVNILLKQRSSRYV
jgi:DNA-nicking Smr family endonuclease